MANGTRRRNLNPRRRRLSEGEDEPEASNGGFEESMSETSNLSDDNLADDSDLSDAEAQDSTQAAQKGHETSTNPNGQDAVRARKPRRNKKKNKVTEDIAAIAVESGSQDVQNTQFVSSADTNAMKNGLVIDGAAANEEAVEFSSSIDAADTQNIGNRCM